LEPEKVVEIIKDSRSTNTVIDRTTRIEVSTSSTNQNTQSVSSKQTVEEYNEINANCSDNLRKETEVKPPKKRGNFNAYKELQ
jgi:hypothetical protein